MKKLFLPLALFTFIFALSAQAFAQTPISESKRKLIAELVALTDGNDQMGTMVDTLMDYQEESFPAQLEASMSKDSSIPEARRKELIEKSKSDFVRVSQKMRKRIKEEINFEAYLNESVYTIYDKHFTEAELKDLVAFYSTPTGKKTIAVMPAIFADSMKASQEKLLPPLLKIVNEVLEEERKALLSSAQSTAGK